MKKRFNKHLFFSPLGYMKVGEISKCENKNCINESLYKCMFKIDETYKLCPECLNILIGKFGQLPTKEKQKKITDLSDK